ncbi:MAG: hypothetical protein LBU27_04840 [Candidatus Peribacteria bacterium]|nr:hypothetical protein [Candidatus Peribacteria bacterium]
MRGCIRPISKIANIKVKAQIFSHLEAFVNCTTFAEITPPTRAKRTTTRKASEETVSLSSLLAK